MNRKVAPFVENITEAASACLLTMVQGNVLAITLGHWLIASETGFAAGAIASGIMIVWRASRPWMIALILGVATAIVDYFIHPGQFGPAMTEAAATGVGAAALSFLVGTTMKRMRARYWPVETVLVRGTIDRSPR